MTRLSSVTDEEIASLGDTEPPDDQDYEEWESAWAGNLGIPIAEVSEDLPEDRRIRLGISSSGIAGAATDAPLGAEALYITGEHVELCVVQGRVIDELGPVMSDCATAGGRQVECPSESDDLACAHEGGNTVLRGEGLTLAFAMNSSGVPPTPTDGDPLPPPNPAPNVDLFDVIPLLFPDRVCVGFQCARLLHHTPLHVVVNFQFPRRRPRFPPPPPVDFSCDLGEDCRGRIHCFGLPGRPPNCLCLGRAERCNGRDDDCDGTIDNDASGGCEDGIGCTLDFCFEGGCSQGTPERAGAVCSPAFCTQGICNGEVPSWADPSLPRTPPDANGCQLGLNHDFCEEVFDACACNGYSLCSPTMSATQGDDAVVTGCAETPLPVLAPCEVSGDFNACTQEICCEPRPECRYLRLGTQPLSSTTILPADDDLCRSSLVQRRPAGYAVSNRRFDCVRVENYAGDRERALLHCNDTNACTSDVCVDRFSGECTHNPVTRSLPPVSTTEPQTISIAGRDIELDIGCGGVVGGGCGEWRCTELRGAPPADCQLFPTFGHELRGSTADECGANGPYGTCLTDFCDGNGRCTERNPVNELCIDDDGLACTIPRCFVDIIGGLCITDIVDDTCYIDNRCWSPGEFDPSDPLACRFCDPSIDARRWQFVDPAVRPECSPN